MNTQTKVAFLGLGVMGGPMAGHLARAGHDVTVYNRTKARAEEWQARWSAEGLQVSLAETPAAAAKGAQMLFTCVGNDQDLEQVLLGKNGALDAMSTDSLLVDHTTTSANLARALAAQCEDKGVSFIDAPVSGGQAGAENGKLAIMCGGTAEAMAKATPVMDCYAARIVHVGTVGAGQTAKMANQMCIAGVLGGLSEAIRLSQAAGLDLDKTFEAISGGAAQSWQMENRWHTMVKDKFDFGFATDWMRKDLGYALEEARGLGLSSPISALVDQFYAEVQANGGGRHDTSALISRLPKGEK
ncbi:NAD(P)-dependent oxidoreductase [Altererythrobacter sp.]|uniref:NAD(P)-dependent oxidoreductase n=1 Tax=Altererythrobacter sp. TaxID=1872480 RepID=UPI001B0445E9|nr:NAD(P)-dependent oxidoreductase [Altererythrobacter sp.]MBO6608813.1 NAD(P)-dependent oxidoreductase [Altererythrobacter sp.]MBO6640853.1 NAD(P)-dependent oxidoreductase [Altererythrobacter sp.]MBO6708449.1 NAD(P)-dependent oxidoreductase [Altererythrobacter sp.]